MSECVSCDLIPISIIDNAYKYGYLAIIAYGLRTIDYQQKKWQVH